MTFNPRPKQGQKPKKQPKPLKRTPLKKVAVKPKRGSKAMDWSYQRETAQRLSKNKAVVLEGLRGIEQKAKSKHAIKKVSTKQALATKRKNDMYDRFDRIMIDNDQWHCSGCGSSENLSHSHLVPVSFNKELESSIENIRLHCKSYAGKKGCHDKWEGRNIIEMMALKDFHENMERIKNLDIKYYNIVNAKITTNGDREIR